MELNLKENELEKIIRQAQSKHNTYQGIKNSIIDTTNIKEDTKESYIKMMRIINMEDWNIWIKEELEKSLTGLVTLELLGENYSTAMEIDKVKCIINELFKNGGEVECCGEDLFKFYLEGRLIYTVSSL